MRLPGDVEKILSGLEEIQFNQMSYEAVSISGGCINQASCITTAKTKYFLKWNHFPLPGMFKKEYDGLKRLRAVNQINVPEVIYYQDSESEPSLMIMEWIEQADYTQIQNKSYEWLGEQIAGLHLHSQYSSFGLDYDNFIGRIEQQNTWNESWIEFFRKNRLEFQIQLARKANLLTENENCKLDDLVGKLNSFIGNVGNKPCLIHGDLWNGNVIFMEDGKPAIIDPAVYYADREVELAFTELFGGFPSAFYQAYQSIYPLEPGYESRKDIYNLYHLINHLNHFGRGYAPQINQVLEKYS